jgi:hypothetical protein
MQIPIVAGIYADPSGDFRTSYPENYIPVPKAQGISTGYLKPADGLVAQGTGPGVARGGIEWRGQLFRVMGTTLLRIDAAGNVIPLGTVAGGDAVTMDYSADRLAIAAGGNLYYWNGSTLTQVTDPDLGTAIDVVSIGGYFATTDGSFIVVTELTDPTQVNPLKYGTSETDPDMIKAVDRLRNELYALNRHTIEAFQNVGGDLFPFQRIDGAQVQKGIIGTHAYCLFAETFAFVGSGRNEAPAVYLMGSGSALKLSTRDIDTLLATYSEADLSTIYVECRKYRGHEHLMIHLPDRCIVYDAEASKVMQAPIWFTLHSGIETPATYRARHFVWAFGAWNVADPTSATFGRTDETISSHYGAAVGWRFATPIIYADGADAIIHELELVALPGRVALSADPIIWTSYSTDGELWSMEVGKGCGKIGERDKRLVWRKQGRISHYRMQQFRGTSDARVSVARLEAQVEALA